MTDLSVDFTPQLRQFMHEVQISSFTQLSQASGVPRSQLVRLRRGDLARIPFGSFVALARVLQVSPQILLQSFGAIAAEDSEVPAPNALQHWQQSGLEILESLIVQLPTAAFAARNNPTAPAVKLLPLLNPLDQLLRSWDVETIGDVGAAIAFNPQFHQWIGSGAMPETGSQVKVRYVGYLHGDRLLHRAKVGPL